MSKPKLTYRKRRFKVRHQLLDAGSASAAGSQSLPPQDDGVLYWLRIVVSPHSHDREPQALVEEARGIIRASYLEGGPRCAELLPVVEHTCEERRGHPAATKSGRHSQIVDMQLVQNAPERTKPHGFALVVFRQIAERHVAVLKLRDVHLPSPRNGERQLLDRENLVDLL